MADIGIIGYGVVGEATAHGFEQRKPNYHQIKHYDVDSSRSSDNLETVVFDSEFLLLCLPTPYNEQGIDLSILDKTVEKITPITDHTGAIIVTKSTVIPGTTKKYARTYPNSHFAFNPEFLTENNYLDDAVNPDRIVIGADDRDVSDRLSGLYARNFPGVPMYVNGSGEAELSKYMANIFLATKVTVGNVFYEICERMGLDYDQVKRMVLADARIGPTHLDVPGHDGHFGFGMKCFPKDLAAIMGLCRFIDLDPKLLQTVWDENLRFRPERDWDEIEGVRT